MLVVAGYDHWILKVLATGHGSYLLSAVTIMICWAYFLDIIPLDVFWPSTGVHYTLFFIN